jgi:hypothetical protein
MIEDFQRALLADYFAGARELVVILSKKNGKTSLFAALALWHVITVPFADVAILAASRDQAGKLLQQLTGYIKRSARTFTTPVPAKREGTPSVRPRLEVATSCSAGSSSLPGRHGLAKPGGPSQG